MKVTFWACLLSAFFTLTTANAQTCDCAAEISFLRTAYMNDYAGIQDFKRAHPNYATFFDNLSAKAQQAKDVKKCDGLIKSLIDYLDNGHVVYGQTEKNPLYGKDKPHHAKESLEPTIRFPRANTAVLTIKTCNLSYKSHLDSIVGANSVRFQNIEHLIIDLRGNEGGGDAMFDTLIPYLYTNPILFYSADLWASENNIKVFEDFLTNPDVPEESKKTVETIVANGKKNPNQFVPMSENKIDTLVLDSVRESPKKVSVLIDQNCKSATEQFLLLAKQSKKTTLYGMTNSGGALDYANLNFVETPSGYWYASVPTTRTRRLPEFPVDPKGIAPDVLVDKRVKDLAQWVMNRQGK
jgi:hypothetical protein